jgi:hypothetical protein
MGQIRAGWLSADGSHDSVLVKQSECVVEPLLTPPLPAESCALPGAHQVPPNLLLHPELNVGKTSARVPYRKVVHPTPQNWIDKFNHPPYGLADISLKDFLKLLQERRPLLQLGHVLSPPRSLTAANPAILKP